MVNPIPGILLDGAWINCVVGGITADGKGVFASDKPTLVGAMTIDWGRQDIWTQPDPSVLSFTFWEPQGLDSPWVRKVLNRNAIRKGVRVVYARGGTFYPGDKIMFDGFTTNVDVTPATRPILGNPAAPGWLVTVQACDRSGVIGQENWGSGILPEQNAQSRAVEIRNRASPAGVRQVYFEARFVSGLVRAIDVTDTSVLDTLNQFYRCFGDQWTYNPQRNVIIRIPGGSNFSAYSLDWGISPNDRRVRIYPPQWVDPTGTEDAIDTRPYPAGYIGAHQVTADMQWSAEMGNDITHIQVKWWRKSDDTTQVTERVVRNQVPRSRLTIESWFVETSWITGILDDLQGTVDKDGRIPMHPRIVWDTKRHGDIPDWQTFESLTLPAQTVRMVTLAGSPYSAESSGPPVWHPAGGIIRYEAGRWNIAVDLAPTTMPLPGGFVPVTFNGLPTNMYIGPNGHNGYYIDDSITSYDLQFVSNTAGVFTKD